MKLYEISERMLCVTLEAEEIAMLETLCGLTAKPRLLCMEAILKYGFSRLRELIGNEAREGNEQ